MPFSSTADLYDEYGETLQVPSPLFNDYGGKSIFEGEIATVKTHEDNSLIRSALETAGRGRVLVVDGGGSTYCALLGDRLAQLGVKNNWAGIIIFGCIRDAAAIAKINIGIKALNTNPRKSVKRGCGEHDIPVAFAGALFQPKAYIYADRDGIAIAKYRLG